MQIMKVDTCLKKVVLFFLDKKKKVSKKRNHVSFIYIYIYIYIQEIT